MTGRSYLVGPTFALLLAVAAPARAEVCEDAAGDPVPVGLRDGGFDASRSACLHADFDARIGAHALIDTPEFYGTLGGGLDLAIRFVEDGGFEWGAKVSVIDLTFAQTAVLTATETTFGPVEVHGAMARRVREDLWAAGLLRVEVPFLRSIRDASSGGGQVAALVTWAAMPVLAVHGRAGLIGWYGASSGGSTSRGAGVVSADASVHALRWLHVLGGVEAQGGWYREGLDHVALRAGVRVRLGARWRMDTAVMVPLAGAERTDLVFTLGVSRDR